MARGVAGAGAPWSVEPALGTARPHAVAHSPGARVSGHRAHGGADAADRWGEAGGTSRVCPRSARPPPRPTRTTTADAAPRRHRAAHAPRLPPAAARAHTAALSRPVSRASRHRTGCGPAREACPAPCRRPDVAAPPLGRRSQAYEEVGHADRTTPRTVRGLREGAAWRPRARDDPARPGRGVRDAGPWLRAPYERLDAKSGCNAEHRLIDSKRNQCQTSEAQEGSMIKRGRCCAMPSPRASNNSGLDARR
jgi:hypothetical protein